MWFYRGVKNFLQSQLVARQPHSETYFHMDFALNKQTRCHMLSSGITGQGQNYRFLSHCVIRLSKANLASHIFTIKTMSSIQFSPGKLRAKGQHRQSRNVQHPSTITSLSMRSLSEHVGRVNTR